MKKSLRSWKMRAIRSFWDSCHNKHARLLWRLQDGYGTPGAVPSQGFDWSGIRDSSDDAVNRMFEFAARVLGLDYGVSSVTPTPVRRCLMSDDAGTDAKFHFWSIETGPCRKPRGDTFTPDQLCPEHGGFGKKREAACS